MTSLAKQITHKEITNQEITDAAIRESIRLREALDKQRDEMLAAKLRVLHSELTKYPQFALFPIVQHSDGSGRLVSMVRGKIEKTIEYWDSYSEAVQKLEKLLRKAQINGES